MRKLIPQAGLYALVAARIGGGTRSGRRPPSTVRNYGARGAGLYPVGSRSHRSNPAAPGPIRQRLHALRQSTFNDCLVFRCSSIVARVGKLQPDGCRIDHGPIRLRRIHATQQESCHETLEVAMGHGGGMCGDKKHNRGGREGGEECRYGMCRRLTPRRCDVV